MKTPSPVTNRREPVVSRDILLPFILLTTLFAWWGLANNMTDTLLPAFKRIMSLEDSKTAWIQVVCYALGYGCFAIPGAIFMMRYTYKSGVLLGLGFFITGTLLFFPARCAIAIPDLCYAFYLCAILITFGGLAILETACNAYICAMGNPATAVRRLNLAQSFNPFGSLVGIAVSQVFILSQLSPLSAAQRAGLSPEELAAVQKPELAAISYTYAAIGIILLITWLMIFLCRMPNLREQRRPLHLAETARRLVRNKRYLCGVVALFFCVGSHIGCWSFTVRYCMATLHLDQLAQSDPALLRNVEPISSFFYRVCEWIHFHGFIPQTAEQAGATFYVLSQILFISGRFICTGLMRFIRPRTLLIILSATAALCMVVVVFVPNVVGVYALILSNGCMSLMFPTIFSFSTQSLGEDTKLAGAGLVSMLCGGAILTQIQGIISDRTGHIELAYIVPFTAFVVIFLYACAALRVKNTAVA